MGVAALIAWLVTAGGGLFLSGTWLAKGDMWRHEPGTSRFPPALALGHAGFGRRWAPRLWRPMVQLRRVLSLGRMATERSLAPLRW